MGESNENRLTPEAKEAINNYLLKLFAILGITNLVLLIGALVYVVFILPTQAAQQAVARVESQVDSSVQVLLDKSVEAYEQLGRARELSERVKKDAETDLQQLGEEGLKLRAELERVRQAVGDLSRDDTVQIASVAATLRQNPKVIEALNLLPRIERLEGQKLGTRYKYAQFVNVPSPTVIPDSRGATFCALAGVDDDDASGACFLWRDRAGDWIHQTGGAGGVNDCRYICGWISIE